MNNTILFKRGAQLLNTCGLYIEVLVPYLAIKSNNRYAASSACEFYTNKYNSIRMLLFDIIFDGSEPKDRSVSRDDDESIYGTTGYFLQQFFDSAESLTVEYLTSYINEKEYLSQCEHLKFELLNYVKMNRRSF